MVRQVCGNRPWTALRWEGHPGSGAREQTWHGSETSVMLLHGATIGYRGVKVK